ncbi:MAG: hypothetical protein U0930_25070 [Pirellulales bacterium]
MIQFNIYLYALPDQPLKPQGQLATSGRTLQTWQVDNIDRHMMPVSFEQVEQCMSNLPRMFFELDGSFVWRGSSPDSADSSTNGSTNNWQIDGMVYDVAGQVARIELKGHCPIEVFVQLLSCIQPADKLLAYSLDHGCFFRVGELLETN